MSNRTGFEKTGYLWPPKHTFTKKPRARCASGVRAVWLPRRGVAYTHGRGDGRGAGAYEEAYAEYRKTGGAVVTCVGMTITATFADEDGNQVSGLTTGPGQPWIWKPLT